MEVDDPDEVIVEPPANTLPRFRFSWRKLAKFMARWLMSPRLDPGNPESDLQQGAYTGYSLVWILWWATVMGPSCRRCRRGSASSPAATSRRRSTPSTRRGCGW